MTTGLRPLSPRLPAGLRTVLGGPRGARAVPATGGRAGLGPVAPVVLLLGLPLVVAVLRQASCASTGWEGRAPLWRMCGSPLLASVTPDGAGRGVFAYLTGGVPSLDVPVLQGLTTTLLATLAPGTGLGQQRVVLVLWLLLAAVVLAGLVVVVATVRGTRAADPVALALSPVLAVSVLLSADLVPVALATVAVWAWTRRRPELAGALAGLAVLGGRPAVLVLVALAVTPPAGLRSATRRLLTAAGVSLLVVVGPLAALDAGVLVRPLEAWWNGSAGAGSLLFVPELALHPLGGPTVAVVSLLGLVLAIGLVLLLASRTPAPPVADLALLGVAAALLTAPSFTPGAAIWLVPFVALAGIRWRDHLVWAGAEAVHLVAHYGWLVAASDPAKGLPAGWYATALALRLLAVGRLAWVVWARASWGERGEAPWDHRPDRHPPPDRVVDGAEADPGVDPGGLGRDRAPGYA